MKTFESQDLFGFFRMLQDRGIKIRFGAPEPIDSEVTGRNYITYAMRHEVPEGVSRYSKSGYSDIAEARFYRLALQMMYDFTQKVEPQSELVLRTLPEYDIKFGHDSDVVLFHIRAIGNVGYAVKPEGGPYPEANTSAPNTNS